MKTIEEAIQDLIFSINYKKDYYFEMGAEWALNNQWQKIERDKDGFATDECLDKIFSENENILFYDIKNKEIKLCNRDFDYWRGDIEIKTKYTYWMPIPKINK